MFDHVRKIMDGFENSFRLIVDGSFVIMLTKENSFPPPLTSSQLSLKLRTLEPQDVLVHTVGQDIFADMIFSRISWFLRKLRKYHVSKHNLYDLITKIL